MGNRDRMKDEVIIKNIDGTPEGCVVIQRPKYSMWNPFKMSLNEVLVKMNGANVSLNDENLREYFKDDQEYQQYLNRLLGEAMEICKNIQEIWREGK